MIVPSPPAVQAPVVPGRLYVVATPIGNLGDITLRALSVLAQVDVIAAEDTRTAQRLLECLHIRAGRAPAELVSFFSGNEAARTPTLLAMLAEKRSVALISEAGLPGISDPGERLVAAARQQDVPVEVIPGACAALTALVGSGLPTSRFEFVGFLPRKDSDRDALLASLRTTPATLLLYESPERTHATLRVLATALGPSRAVCLSRELTKRFEEHVRGTLAEVAEKYADTPPRGEVTLVIAGAGPSQEATENIQDRLAQLEQETTRRLGLGHSAKEIAAALSISSGQPRRKIYQLALALSGRGRNEKSPDESLQDATEP